MRSFHTASILAGVALILPTTMEAAPPKPNIIHILADDLGWGSVGFNGQTAIQTPNLDRLANQGMVFNNSYSATVCAPTRAMLYTGFHQGHARVDSNGSIGSGFRSDDIMTGQVLQEAGYSTAIFGKWGFGASGSRTIGPTADPTPTVNSPTSLPSRHGFEQFYGYLNHGAAHDYYYDWMWKSDSSTPGSAALEQNSGGPSGEPRYTHDLFAEKSEQYVAAHAGGANPFYMQLNYTIPHFDIDGIADAPGGYGPYAGRPWTTEQKAYAAMVTRMDTSIGSLLAKLEDPNGDGDASDSIAQDTLIWFTSDNGPTPEDASPISFFDAAGVYRGGKRDLYEGGIHVPALAYWPGTIAPGARSNRRTDVADFLATATELAGVDAPVGIDGVSLTPTLTGAGRQRSREHLVFEHHEGSGPDPDSRAALWTVIRQDGMKVIRFTNGTSDVFNLTADPGETNPLDAAAPANAQLVADFEAVAWAEGIHQGSVENRSWIGASGGLVEDDANWSGNGRPEKNWSAVVTNASSVPSSAPLMSDITTLGFEVRGSLARQTVDVQPGRTLTGRNEVRISRGGRIELADATLSTNRWVDVREQGQLHGVGLVNGEVYNSGRVAPGRSADLGALPAGPPPPPLPPTNLDTGVVTAVQFNFAGIQDDAPLTQTSALSPYGELVQGFDFGPGVSPRGSNNAGNEFNVQGHVIGGTLQDAIDHQDYLSFVIDPVEGAGLIPESVSFRLWRNGGNAAQEWAILSSIDGFTTNDVLAQINITDAGSSNQHLLTANFASAPAVTDPVEVRLYGWRANGAQGNTHVNYATMSGRFIGVPTLAFDFAGVQDNSPLVATTQRNESLQVVDGLAYGPGLNASHPAGGGTNVGNEFNVAGFSSGTTLTAAIEADDYMSFSVQAVEGMAIIPSDVSFTLWRHSAASAGRYAILSSIDGFESGEELASAAYSDSGQDNQHTVTGTFADAEPTAEPVEFRLYGFNAATLQDNTHVMAVSMRARFVAVAGQSIGPAGRLSIIGDFYHLSGGELAIELGGRAQGTEYDLLAVDGAVSLEGDLTVSTLDLGGGAFNPMLGDSFTVLTATEGVTGTFSAVDLPDLAPGLDWHVNYDSDSVTLEVLNSADFNRDGQVDGDDLSAWSSGFGIDADVNKSKGDDDGDGDVDGSDFLAWQRSLGAGAAPAAGIPEPASFAGFCLALAAAAARRRTI